MKTAIQEALETIKKKREMVYNQYKSLCDSQEKEKLSNMLTGLDFGVKTLTDLLPKEREQIEGSWEAGNYVAKYRLENETQYQSTSEEYYNETFKQ
jgi:hypothetical protein